MKPIRLLALLSALALWVPGWAREHPFVDEDYGANPIQVPERKPWEEGAFTLPPYPKDADLVAFSVDDPASPFRYYLDARHLSVGADQVVHYTLVIRSASGASNVSVEGMRCDDRRMKVFAYGGARGKLHPVPRPEWEPVRLSGADHYHKDLRDFYLCNLDRHRPWPLKEILHRLHEAPQPTDDMSGLL